MVLRPTAFVAILGLGAAAFADCSTAGAQEALPRISLKSGETIDLRSVYFTRNCRSILKETPIIEVLEGPEELTLTIKPEMVIPRDKNCASPVEGGTVVVKAAEVKAAKEAKLTYRVKYKTLEGERQNAQVYLVSLFP